MFCFKGDLCEKVKENNKQREEIIHLQQENGSLRNELTLFGECGPWAFHALAFSSSETSRQQQFTNICEGGGFSTFFLQFCVSFFSESNT